MILTLLSSELSCAVQFYKLSFCIRSKHSYIKMLVSTASLICARNLCLGNVRLLCTSSIPPIPRGMLNLKQVTYILNISTTNSYKVLTYSIIAPKFKKDTLYHCKVWNVLSLELVKYYYILNKRSSERNATWGLVPTKCS